MKKIISIIAALAMVMAFVGCDIELKFSEQTIEFANDTIIDTRKGSSVYPISNITMTPNDYITVSETGSVTDYDGYPLIVKLTSKAGGGSVTNVSFESVAFAKKASGITLSVSELGSITGLYDLKYFEYDREWTTTPAGVWKDYPGAAVGGMQNGTYVKSDDSTKRLVVNGNIVYQLINYGSSTSEKYMRTVFSLDNGVLAVEEDTTGYFQYTGSTINYILERGITNETDTSAFIDFGGFTVIGTANSISFAKDTTLYDYTKL